MIECAINRTRVLKLKPNSNLPNGRCTVVVTCDKCQATAERILPPNMPPQVVAQHYNRLGWKVEQDGRSATCPACSRKSVAARESTQQTPVVVALRPRTCLYSQCGKPIDAAMRSDACYCNAQCRTLAAIERKNARKAAEPKEVPVSPNIRPNSPESLRSTRALVRLLDQHFSEETHRYGTGWSDEKVAKETGLAVDFVAQFRRESYGEIVDPELSEIRTQLGALETKANQDLRELADLYESTRAQLTGAIEALRQRLAKLEAKR